MIKRTPLAVILAAFLVVTTALTAQAVTSCNVYHTYQSDGRAYVDVWNDAGATVRLWRGGDSCDYSSQCNRVQRFRIRGGIGCVGRSQYSPPGAYPYQGGVTYAMSRSGLNLSITTTCPV